MKGSFNESVLEIVRFVVIVLIIVVPIRLYVGQPFIVSGESMVPTFANGEYLIVDELSYHFRDPVRGEVIIFRYPKDPSKFFIKRIIGLPGETVAIGGNIVSIKSGDETIILDEPYIESQQLQAQTLKLGVDEYFVMGDNRGASLDSRSWGVLEESLIQGRAFIRLLPINKLSYLPGT